MDTLTLLQPPIKHPGKIQIFYFYFVVQSNVFFLKVKAALKCYTTLQHMEKFAIKSIQYFTGG